MEVIANSYFFGILLTLICYEICIYLKKYIKSPLFNPVIFTTIFVVVFLNLFSISYETYNNGASFLTNLLLPATAILALNIYHQRALLKKYWLPILGGCISGAITSIISVITLSKLLGLDTIIETSLIPKSITTAIAIDVSTSLGGIPSITVISVIITGMIGAMFAPLFIKIFKIDNDIAQGCAIGTASHALGTTKAIELGEIHVAISSVSIIITGIATVIITLLLR